MDGTFFFSGVARAAFTVCSANESDGIADKMMESSETHDCFFNWLGFKGKEEEQLLVEYLQRKSIQVVDPVEPVFIRYSEQ